MRRITMRRVSLAIALLLCAATPALPQTTLTLAGGITSEDIFVKLDGDLSAFSYYDIQFHIDPVLRNTLQGNLTFNIWLFRFGIGAFFSTFDEGGAKYAPGVSGSLGIEAPGALSVFVEYGQSLFADLSDEGDVRLNYGKLEATIWLPYVLHILPRFIAQRKSLAVEPAGNYDLEDSLVRYEALLDIFFNKAASFLITLGAGYQTLRTVTTPLPPAAPSARSWETEIVSQLALAGVLWKIHPDWTVFFNTEVPVSSQGGITNLKAAAGFKITLSNFKW
jgi:hypothetical protein